jgi:peptidoglycan/LPS O-acetylase OafA/YrhL
MGVERTDRYPHVPALDGLRACAIGLVLIFHTGFGLKHFVGGWIGVDLFFVLSGYLITGLLVTELAGTNHVRLGAFYGRRALRLLPALVAAVALAGVLWRLAPTPVPPTPAPSFLAAAGYVLAYAANLVPKETLGPLNHCWSLAVEEHYYLIWPPLLTLAWMRLGWVGAVAAAICGTAVVIGYRAWGVLPWGVDPYRFTLTRADALFIGSAAALLLPPRPAGPPARVPAVIIALGLLAAVAFSLRVPIRAPWLYKYGFTVIALAAATVVVAATRPSWAAGLLATRPLVWVGQRSYGLYLYHLPVYAACAGLRIRGNAENFVWLTALRLVATFIIAALSYQFLERPFLRFKDRLRPNGTRRVSLTPQPSA